MTRPDQSIYVGIVRMVRGVVRMSAYSFDDVILHPFLLHRLTYAPCLQHTPPFWFWANCVHCILPPIAFLWSPIFFPR